MTEHGYKSEMYRCESRESLFYFIRHYPFATLIPAGCPDGDLAFIPLVLDHADGAVASLVGHIDNANPFLEHLDDRPLQAVFAGPNGYISPSDYVSEQLPTWNYAVAQVSGSSRLITDDEEKLARMVWTIDRLERGNAAKFALDEKDQGIRSLIQRITFFRIEIESVRGTFKFSQEKASADRISARETLLKKLHATQSRVVPRLIDSIVV